MAQAPNDGKGRLSLFTAFPELLQPTTKANQSEKKVTSIVDEQLKEQPQHTLARNNALNNPTLVTETSAETNKTGQVFQDIDVFGKNGNDRANSRSYSGKPTDFYNGTNYTLKTNEVKTGAIDVKSEDTTTAEIKTMSAQKSAATLHRSKSQFSLNDENPQKPFAYSRTSFVNGGTLTTRTTNPIVGLKQTLSPLFAEEKSKELKSKLPVLNSLTTAWYFNEKKAEKELSEYLRFHPYDSDAVVNLVDELFKNCQTNHKLRLYDVLGLAIINEENLLFVLNCVKKFSADEVGVFAVSVVKCFANTKQFEALKQLSSVLTVADTQNQKRGTLFRSADLSSAISKEYGSYLWAGEVKELDFRILKELTKYKNESKDKTLWQLRMDRFGVREYLKLDDGFNQLSPTDQSEMLEKRLGENATRFAKFAMTVIPEIYYMKISDEFAELLRTRRTHIIKFLKDTPVEFDKSKESTETIMSDNNSNTMELAQPSALEENPLEESKKYISELIFLRIISPHLSQRIMPPTTHPDENRIFVQLTALIQNIANGQKFDEAKYPFNLLNPIIDDFKETHDEFIDKYTTPKS